MWFWEITWQKEDGSVFYTRSSTGYAESWMAQKVYETNAQTIMDKILSNGAVAVLDVQIVFESRMTGFNN